MKRARGTSGRGIRFRGAGHGSLRRSRATPMPSAHESLLAPARRAIACGPRRYPEPWRLYSGPVIATLLYGAVLYYAFLA